MISFLSSCLLLTKPFLYNHLIDARMRRLYMLFSRESRAGRYKTYAIQNAGESPTSNQDMGIHQSFPSNDYQYSKLVQSSHNSCFISCESLGTNHLRICKIRKRRSHNLCSGTQFVKILAEEGLHTLLAQFLLHLFPSRNFFARFGLDKNM